MIASLQKVNRMFRNEKRLSGHPRSLIYYRVSSRLPNGLSLEFVFYELYQLALQVAAVASPHLSSC